MVGTISRDELKNKILRGETLRLVETLPEDKFREEHLSAYTSVIGPSRFCCRSFDTASLFAASSFL